MWLTVLLLLVGGGLNAAYSYGTARTVTIEVTDKERVVTKESAGGVDSYYLVSTKNHGVFKNVDTGWYLKFNSSSVQGRLERGKKYTVKVYGWGVGYLSMYPNIVGIVE
ncbi:MAG: DUF1523 family protein [Parcubacteria group bacterium]|nr:DUF1523 family protein [Parcubacteria group bacterium]